MKQSAIFCARMVDFVQACLYLHKLPFCNNAHRQVCITICEQAVYNSHMKQSGHMHVHACTHVATLKVHKCVTLMSLLH